MQYSNLPTSLGVISELMMALSRLPYDNGMPNAVAGNLPSVKTLIRAHVNPYKVTSGVVPHILVFILPYQGK